MVTSLIFHLASRYTLTVFLTCSQIMAGIFHKWFCPQFFQSSFFFQDLRSPGDNTALQPSSLAKTHLCESRSLSLDPCTVSSFQHLLNPTSLTAAESIKPTCDGRPQIYLPVWMRQAPTLLALSLNFWENTSSTWKEELEISSWKMFPISPRLPYIVILRKFLLLLCLGLERSQKHLSNQEIIFWRVKKMQDYSFSLSLDLFFFWFSWSLYS